MNHRPRMKGVNNAAIDERNTFLTSTRSHLSNPCQAQLPHILLIDLVQWTEPLRVVCPAEHEPVIWTRIAQCFIGHGHEVLRLRVLRERLQRNCEKENEGYEKCRPDHWIVLLAEWRSSHTCSRPPPN